MSKKMLDNNFEKFQFKLSDNEILIKDAYIIVTYSFDLCTNGSIDSNKLKTVLASRNSTEFTESYQKQSDRIFKMMFNQQFERIELPSAKLRFRDFSDVECFDVTPILSIHKKTGVCILSLWVRIFGSYPISLIIDIRNKIGELDTIEISLPNISDDYINYLVKRDYASLNNYVGFMSKNLGKIANLNEYIYTSLLILDSSISDRLDDILSDSLDYDWEKRQIYGLITKNDIGRCMGMRKDVIKNNLDSEIDFRIGMATWFKEFSTITIYSDISKKYVEYRQKQKGKTSLNKLLHTALLDIVIAEFLIFQITLITRFSEKVTEILAICDKISPRNLSEEWENIIRYSEYFYHSSVLRYYDPGFGRYQEIKKNSPMDELNAKLFESLSMLEKSIQSRYNDAISEKNLKVQYSLFALQVFVIFSVLNPLFSKNESQYSIMISLMIFILSIIIALILIYFIKKYYPIFDEFLSST